MAQITMDDSGINNIQQIKEFLNTTKGLNLSLTSASVEDKYEFISKTLKKFKYFKLSRKDKGYVFEYLRRVTGYKRSHLYYLIGKLKRKGRLKRKKYKRSPSKTHRKYNSFDIKLLEKTDELHLRLSDRATKEILRREFEVFGNKDYERLKDISHSHITNLRSNPVYKNFWVNHTKKRTVPIGINQPPENYGKPGSIRVDTVHQRDIYHINAVDEVTQWQVVVVVPLISERYMIPALNLIFSQFPFVIFNFHSDRGSENINYRVAQLLSKLNIKQTKSRPRRPNDNALVETKNGSVIRKNMGWQYLPDWDEVIKLINNYYLNYFNPYLNYHRPCGYPTSIIDKRGKVKRVYYHYKVPYEYLKSLPDSEKYLKPNLSFEKLDKIAYQLSDNEFAEILRGKERELFDKIDKLLKKRESRKITKRG